MCVDKTDLKIQGGLSSQNANTVLIDIVKCTGKDYCKSEQEIKEYFTDNLFYILGNEIRFDQ